METHHARKWMRGVVQLQVCSMAIDHVEHYDRQPLGPPRSQVIGALLLGMTPIIGTS